jgi:hypothetical protein
MYIGLGRSSASTVQFDVKWNIFKELSLILLAADIQFRKAYMKAYKWRAQLQ